MTRPRRTGILPTVGLVVEGVAEFLALPRLHTRSLITACPPLKPINLGGVGSDRSAVGIAKLVAPKVVQHKVAGRGRVVVCLDREQRSECAAWLAGQIRRALAVELVQKGHTADGVHVVVADRSFEAWLLAGWPSLHARGVLKSRPKWTCFEGELGAEGKKGAVELGRLLDRPYGKTSDGPRLLENLDISAARRHGPGLPGSKSFDKFLRSVGI